MNKSFTSKNAILPFIVGFAMNGFTQVAGDFQTKTPSANWSDFNAWNVHNGTMWVAAVSGQIPSSTNSVYVQSGHTISVDNAGAVCNDINVNGSITSKIIFLAAGILNVKGNMTLFSTGHNCFGAWAPAGKIVFSGTGMQGFTNLSVNSEFVNIEVNKVSGTLTTSSNFRFASFTLTAGNFSVGSANEIQGSSGAATITINGGAWTQILSTTKIFSIPVATPQPIGAIIINSGVMILATSNSLTGFMLSTMNVINGGTLTLNNFPGNISIGSSIIVDATSTFNTALTITPLPALVTFNGIVNYNHTGSQTVSAATYSYLKISGTGAKTLAGGTTTIAANGTLEMSGIATAPTLVLGGALNVSTTGTHLIYSSSGFQTASAVEWNANFQNININNTAGVSMAGLTRSIFGTLSLTNGTLNIGAGGSLNLNGASLSRTNGFLDGTSTSDLAIAGTTGGIVLLPLSGNISLRNVTIAGTRVLAMDGMNNVNLHGVFNIGSTAVYDNGGESQIIQGGGGSIVVAGRFINRDKDNFTGSMGAVPGIIPTLNGGCTIEYGLGGDQVVSARSDYQNITFSGSGTKTLANTFAPSLGVYITNSAIVYAGHNFGDNGIAPFTNLTMDGGRLILATTGTQPCMTGTYTLTGGIVEFASSQLTAQAIRSKSYQNIEVTGNNVGNSTGNIGLNANGTFTVKTGGVFEINDNCISGPGGTQIVTVENGGIFRTGNNEGFNGYNPTFTNNSSIHQNITNIYLNAGSTVEYMRSGDQPLTSANGLIYSNLMIAGNGIKTAPAGILNVQGNLIKTGTGTFIHNNGTVLLNGSGGQSFAGLTYNNLILTNNIKTTSGNSTIIDSIKISAGTTLSVSPSDTITLHSDATKTARMAEVDGVINYNTTGKFEVERYIPARKAWRFLAVPTQPGQTIHAAWQENQPAGSTTLTGLGTQITSDRASWSADGFDLFSANGPSMKTYDAVSNTYSGVTSTSAAFSPLLGGYMTFIRGDRTANAFLSPVTSTTLRTKGVLYTGTQTPITVVPGQFTPYNNPYASPLDLRKISQSLSVFFYVWDPNRGGNHGIGAFQTLSWNSGTGNFDVVPGGGSYGPGNIDNFIESGQAFFVAGSAAILPLTENKKGDGGGMMVFRPSIAPPHQLRCNLYGMNDDSSSFLADGAMAMFDDTYSDEVDSMDAKKFSNFGENLSVKVRNELLALDRKHTINQPDTIFLNLSGLRAQEYHFEFIPDNLYEPGLRALLEDNYTLTKTALSLSAATLVNFTVADSAPSYAPGRFRIVFIPAMPLPVTVAWVKAFCHNKNINLEWRVEHEVDMKQYEVEKSTNGIQFNTLAVKRAIANGGRAAVYMTSDVKPVEGYNYYRIKGVDINCKARYTNVVKVMMSGTKPDITIYLNRVTEGVIYLRLMNQPQGKYYLQLINKAGQVIMRKLIVHPGGSSTELIKCNGNLSHGMYLLELTKPGGCKKDINVLY